MLLGLINATRNSDGKEEEPHQPSSILMTFGTMIGRAFNVIGTVKIYKSVAKFVAHRRREQLRRTAERLGGVEADTDWSEALIECCQLFV
uniref:ABC transmembrane type-1 domain-containing protein n=1 Tax=Ascaris lumbricoides TaxID=6252 RepID=A0A0M3I6T1_ASCLU